MYTKTAHMGVNEYIYNEYKFYAASHEIQLCVTLEIMLIIIVYFQIGGAVFLLFAFSALVMSPEE
jgi:hypothetical protein